MILPIHLNPNPPGVVLSVKFPIGKNWGKLALINSDFTCARDRSRNLSHDRQVSPPLHHMQGLTNSKDLLAIYTRVEEKS